MSDTDSTRPYTVVVGINGSTQSAQALRWAKAQAAAFDGRVIALRTWRTQAPSAPMAGTSAGRVGTSERTESDVREALAEAVEGALGPDHGVELRVVRDGRRAAFIDISGEADLIVLGAPRKLAPGPVLAHRLLYATHCPVVVMPRVEADGPSTLAKVGAAAALRFVTAAGTAGRPGYNPPHPTR